MSASTRPPASSLPPVRGVALAFRPLLALALAAVTAVGPTAWAGPVFSGQSLQNYGGSGGIDYIGYPGTGSATLSDGTSYSLAGHLILGYSAAGNGTITVTGNNSVWTYSGTTYSNVVGESGLGLLNITNYGRLVTANSLYFGHSATGNGTLTLSDHGQLAVTGSVNFGYATTGVGNGHISSGASLTSSFISIGSNGVGSLLVDSGGSISTSSIALGIYQGTNSPSLTVTGAGSTVSTATLQLDANSNVTVSAGAQVTVSGNVISQVTGNATANSIVLTGTGTLLSAGNYTSTGLSGAPNLTVTDGAKLRVSGNFNPGASSTIKIGDGATAIPGTLDVSGVSGGATLIFNHNSSSYLFTNDAGNGISINGSTRVTILNGNTTFTGASVSNGGATITNGTLTLLNTSGNGLAGTITIGPAGTLVIGNGGTAGSIFAISPIVNDGQLTINRSGNVSLTFQSPISGNGTITKLGTGTLDMGGNNSSFAGPIFVNAGTLNLTGTAPLGNASGNTTVASGATLNLATSSVIAEPISIGGTGVGGAGALTGSGTLSGPVTLTSDLLVSNANPVNLTVSGNISETGGTRSITKIGTGNLTLTGSNSYSGATNVNAGTLTVKSAGALGTTDAGTIVSSGASLVLDGNVTVTGEALTLNGVGLSSQGALRNLAGNNTWAGNVTIASASYIVATAGNLTISGVIDGSGSLTTWGAGTIALANANTYTGNVTVNAGVLRLDHPLALQRASFDTYSQSGGTLSFGNLTAATFGGLTGASSSLNLANASGAPVTLTIDTAGTPTYGGTITGPGSLVKAGTGNFTLNGDSTFTGTARVDAGTFTVARPLALQSATIDTSGAGAFVFTSSSATLGGLTGTGDLAIPNNFFTLTLNSAGNSTYAGTLSGAGGLLTKAGTGTLTLAGPSTFAGNTSVTAGTLVLANPLALQNSRYNLSSTGMLSFGELTEVTLGGLYGTGSLTLTNSAAVPAGVNLTLNVASPTTLSNALTGLGSLTKSGTGTLTLGVANTYTGNTVVNGGILSVTQASALGSGSAGTVVNDGGTLQLAVSGMTESLTLAGSGAGGIGALTSQNTVSFAGNVVLAGDTSIGGSSTSLTISGNISDTGGARALTKVGNGTLTLSGVNSYSGLTTVGNGTLVVGSATALGSTAAGVVVASGAALDLAPNVALGAEPITLSGSGISNGGALTGSVYGGNASSAAGPITLATDTSIGANNTLTLSGAIGDGGSARSLTKVGYGTLVLSGDNTYTGATVVNSGILSATTAGALATTSSVTVASGATLAVPTTAFPSHPVTISGNGTSYQGALSLTGTGTVSAPITLAGSAMIGSDSAVTLAGGIGESTPGSSLTLGAGPITLGGTNTYTGSTIVWGDLVILADPSAISTSSGVSILSGARLQLPNDVTINKPLTLASYGAWNGTDYVGGGLQTVGGNSTWAGNVAIDQYSAVYVGAGSLTISGNITESSDHSSLYKRGAGNLILSGNNSFAGFAELTEGSLTLQSSNALGHNVGPSVYTSTAQAGTSLQLQGDITIDRSFLLNGTGVGAQGVLRNLSGNNTWSGDLQFQGGPTRVQSDAGNLSLTGVIYSSDTVTFGGSGMVTIASADTTNFTGAVNIDAGTSLQVGTGTVTSSLNDVANIVNQGTLIYNPAASSTATLSKVISGAGTLQKIGAGNLILSGNNSLFTGGVTVSSGTLTAQGNTTSAKALGTGTLTLAGGTLALLGNATQSFNNNTVVTGDATIEVNRQSTNNSTPITQALGTLAIGDKTLTVRRGSLGTGLGTLTFAATTLTGNATFSPGANTQVTLASVTGTDKDLTFTGTGGNLTVTGALALGTGSIVVNGTGTLTLSGTAAYGNTTINGGNLTLGTSTNLGTGLLTINSGALTYTNTGGLGARTISLNGGTFGFSAAGGVGTGSFTLNGGTLLWSGTNTLDISPRLAAIGAGGATLDVGANNVAFASGLSGSGNVTKQGTGTLTLNGTGTNTGTLIVGNGTLAFGTNGAIGTSNLAVPAGTAALAATNQTAANVSLTGGTITSTTGALSFTTFDAQAGNVTAILDGTGALTKTGSGTVTLSGANTFSGGVTISAGTLTAQTSANALGGGPLTLAGGNLTLADNTGLAFNRNTTVTASSTVTVNRTSSGSGAITDTLGTLSIGAQTLTVNRGSLATGAATLAFGGTTLTGDATFAGNASITTTSVTGSGGNLTYSGTGNMTVSGALNLGTGDLFKSGTGTLTLSGATTYENATITAGTLALGATASLGSGNLALNGGLLSFTTTTGLGTGTLAVNGGGLQWSGANTLDLSSRLAIGTSGATVDIGANTVTFASAVTGSGNMTKDGSGTLILNGANTYTGATVVSAGTLRVGASGSFGSGSIVLGNSTASGATVNLQLQNDAPRTFTNTLTAAGSNTTGNITLDRATAGAAQAYAFNTTVLGNQSLGIKPGSNVTSGTTSLTLSSLTIGNYSAILLGSGLNTTIGSITGDGSTNFRLYNDGNTTITGPITSVAGIAFNSNLTNSGTVFLTGDNSAYAGGFSVNGTTLSLGHANALGTGSIGFNTGTFLFNGITTLANPITLQGGATLVSSSPLTFTGAVSTAGSSTIAGSADATFTGNFSGLSLDRTLTFSLPNTTISGNIAIANSGTARTLTFAGTGNTSISGIISNGSTSTASRVAKSGTGLLTLTGTNTYGGATTISGGILSVGSLANGSVASNIGSSSSGAANLVIDGGTLKYTGAAQSIDRLFTVGVGGATIDASSGALSFTNASSLSATGSGARTLTLTGGTGGSIASVIVNPTVGSTALTKSGAGTWVLSGSNTFTGATAITGGVLNIRANNALGTTAGGTSVTGGAALEMQGGITVGAEALALNGTGVSSAGALRNVSGTNTYGGAITLGSASSIMSDAGQLNLAAITGAGQNLTLGGSGNTTVTGAITTTTGTVTKSGSGILTLSGANTYTGTTAVTGGTLKLGGASAFKSGNSLSIDAGATFDANGFTPTFNLVTGAGTLNVGSGGVNIQPSASMTFSGALAGSGAVAVNASGGDVAFSGSSGSFGGSTAVSGGLFSVNGTLGGTGLSVGSGATLGGSGSISAPTTLGSGGHLAPGNSPGTLTFTNGLTLSAGSYFDFQLGIDAANSDRLRLTGGLLTGLTSGTVTLNLSNAGGFHAGTYTLLDYTGASASNFGTDDFSFGTLIPGYTYSLSLAGSALVLTATASAIPEPSTYAALAGLLALGLALYRRRQRPRAQS